MKAKFCAFLFLIAAGAMLPAQSATPGTATAVFSGGCFWGMEAVFEHLKGVTDVVSGYTGGTLNNPSYEDVSSGATGHAESVKITYNPKTVTYETLLKIYFLVAHDPTELNYQGPDYGTQYRSAIWYADATQKAAAEAAIKQLDKDKVYHQPVVTTVLPLKTFWMAEDYHQDFIKKNPTQGYIVRYDLPKVRFLLKNYASISNP